MSEAKENKGTTPVRAVDGEAISSLGRRPLTLPNPGEASYKNRITPITRHLTKRSQQLAAASPVLQSDAAAHERTSAGKSVFLKKGTEFSPGKRLERPAGEPAGRPYGAEVRFRRRSYRHWSKRTIALYLSILSASGVLAFIVYQLMRK